MATCELKPGEVSSSNKYARSIHFSLCLVQSKVSQLLFSIIGSSMNRKLPM